MFENYSFFDTNGDGVGDVGAADLNADNRIDSYVVDANFDGRFEWWVVDSNNDLILDTYNFDGNGDQYFESTCHDSNEDGTIESVSTDTNLDGFWDSDVAMGTAQQPPVVALIGGTTPSGGTIDPLLNSPALQNDPAAQATIANILGNMEVTSGIWTLPDNMAYVQSY